MKFDQVFNQNEQKFLSDKDKKYLYSLIIQYKGLPNLEELWALMDMEWIRLGCSQEIDDEKVSNFYRHPIWILNGKFTELDNESKKNRHEMAKKLLNYEFNNVGDFGGGYGSLAKEILIRRPDLKIDIIDPYHINEVEISSTKLHNINFIKNFNSNYDLLLATDVFEHLYNPINELIISSGHVNQKGYFYIANNFEPVILCHLPQNYHLKYSFNEIMIALGFKKVEKILYGTLFQKIRKPNIKKAMKIEVFSKQFENNFFYNFFENSLLRIMIIKIYSFIILIREND